MTEYTYYRIESEKITATLEAATARANEVRKAAMAYVRKHGADNTWGNQQRPPIGLMFDKAKGEIPAGFRSKDGYSARGKQYHIAMPDKRTKEGRAIAKDAFWKTSPWDLGAFYTAVNCSGVMVSSGAGLALAFPTAEKLGDAWIVGIPHSKEPTYSPQPGMIELKMSELWALKERHEKAA